MASETIPADNLGDDSQAWRRWVEEGLKKQAKIGRNYGLHQRANDKQKDAFGRALREAGLSQAQLDAAVKDAKRKPAAPANAQTTTDAYFAADGTPQSRVSMSTDVVTVDVNGKSINVANYQLYGRRNVAGTPWRMLAERESPVLVFDPLPIGEEWQFKVHAVSAAGVVGEASAALLVTMARDTTPPGKPAPMTATSRLGQVILSWNGKVEAGLANQPPDYSHSVVYVATSASAAGTAVGQIGTGGDTFYPPEVPYNQARWYFLVSYDKSGNASVPSNRVSIVTKPLVDTDIIGRVMDGANMKLNSIGEDVLSAPIKATLASADGKTKNWYQASAPSGTAHKVGDTWFETDADNKIHQWTGSAWVPVRLGTDAIANASITNALIADATIQHAKIGSVDAGAITVGTLSAERIGASTITANKLLIGDFQNYALDIQNWREREAYPAGGPWRYSKSGTVSPDGITSPWLVILDNGATGYANHRVGEDFAVKPGEEIFISYRARRRGASEPVCLSLQVFGEDDTIIAQDVFAARAYGNAANNAWITYSGRAVIPAGAAYARPMFKKNSNVEMTGGDWALYEPIIRRVTTGELLVDGAVISRTIATDAVVARTIAANQIEADHIKSNAITADKINAGAITADKIDAGAITAVKIAGNSITGDKIQANAITADKIDANAINGKTITGALVRSAASGARTEMTNQGLQTLDAAGNPLVRIGYGVPTGMQVRNPASGALIPLGPHVFGTQGYTSTTNLNVTSGTAGNWGAYTDEYLGPTTGVMSSPTGRMLVFAQVNLSYNSALDTEFQIVADLSSPSGSVRFINHMPLYGGAMTHVAIVNVVAGRIYRPFFAIRGRSGTSGRVSTFVLRTMVAMPI